MGDLFHFFLKLPGGVILLVVAYFAAAFIARSLVVRRPDWRSWQIVFSAAIAIPLLALLLTIVAVSLTLHEDGLVPLALMGLGIPAITLSFLVGVVSASIVYRFTRS